MSTAPPRIALLSGLAAAAPPAEAALAERFPEAQVWNLLDDRLIADSTRLGAVTPELEQRFLRLARHAALGGADGVLITCSLYSHLAERMQRSLGMPVLGPDDAAFDEVLASGASSVHLVSGVPLALEDAAVRLAELARSRGVPLRIVPVLVEEARAASLEGDHARGAAAIAGAVAAGGDAVEQVLLVNFSLAPAAESVAELLGAPVVTGPASAALRLRESVLAPASA